jgi:hypothetical protein
MVRDNEEKWHDEDKKVFCLSLPAVVHAGFGREELLAGRAVDRLVERAHGCVGVGVVVLVMLMKVIRRSGHALMERLSKDVQAK